MPRAFKAILLSPFNTLFMVIKSLDYIVFMTHAGS